MNKLSITALISAICIGGAFTYFTLHFSPIISGFGAKALCSCAYNGGRTLESVKQNELGAFPLSLGTFWLNPEDQSAEGHVFGFASAKAIYRKGLGCTLVREISEEEIRKQTIDIPAAVKLSDTTYWPLGNKRVDTLTKHVDYDQLNAAVEGAFLNSHADIKTNTRAVVVVQNGQIITEKYAEGYTAKTPQVGWSMTKSVTSTLYGIMQKKGMVDVSKPTGYADWQADERAKITYNDLIQMNAGLVWDEVYSNVSTATKMIYNHANMGAYAASQMAQYAPGTHWKYSSGTTNILTLLMRQKLGDEAYYKFAQNELFNKIGVTSAVIEPDAAGNFVASSYMWASAEDWARMGLLYLNEGNWFGEQIIDSSWVAYAQELAPNTPRGEYGGQFWLNKGEEGNSANRFLPSVSTELYMMRGYEGQRVYILPSKNLVVVRLGQEKKGGFDEDTFLSNVVKSIK